MKILVAVEDDSNSNEHSKSLKEFLTLSFKNTTKQQKKIRKDLKTCAQVLRIKPCCTNIEYEEKS